MNITQLDLLILETSDLKQIVLSDISRYNSDLPIEDPIIEITPPNFSTIYLSEYIPSQANILDSNVLWSKEPIKENLIDLQDGLWTIKQSIKPNGLINRTYVYFRILNLKSMILTKISTVFCDKDEPWYLQAFLMLQKLEAAKYMAEHCGSCEEAKIIYNQILIQANSLNCDC